MNYHFMSRGPGDISWRVSYTIGGITNRQDFSDSEDANRFFELYGNSLRNINDWAVLYRLNRKGPGWVYQDPYKFAIMSPHGPLFRYAPYSPRTWEDAERIITKLRAYRKGK